VPIEAILDRELYYKRNSESLVSNYVFDNRKWQADNYFFSKNYLLIKESGQDIYLAATTWREETNTMLSNYKAQYALSYIFAANQMGWINCDRFRYSPNSAEIYVKGIDTRNTDFKLIFEDENSILPVFAMGNQIVFSNIPAGKKVKLLGMRQTLQHPEFVIQSLETGKKQVFTNFAFQALNFSDLEKMLAVKN
jgi:hypothetical protein